MNDWNVYFDICITVWKIPHLNKLHPYRRKFRMNFKIASSDGVFFYFCVHMSLKQLNGWYFTFKYDGQCYFDSCFLLLTCYHWFWSCWSHAISWNSRSLAYLNEYCSHYCKKWKGSVNFYKSLLNNDDLTF